MLPFVKCQPDSLLLVGNAGLRIMHSHYAYTLSQSRAVHSGHYCNSAFLYGEMS
jgi:hypothetical protein